jgi:hypothetical protein
MFFSINVARRAVLVWLNWQWTINNDTFLAALFRVMMMMMMKTAI